MKATHFVFLLTFIFFGSSLWAFRPISVSGPENVAIDGYDVVAYHTRKQAVKGSAFHVVEWEGAKWHFSSKTHLRMFRQDPEKFAPVFGGFCTVGLSHGPTLYQGDPEAFVLYEGKLYLASSSEQAIELAKDPEAYIEEATESYDAKVAESESAEKTDSSGDSSDSGKEASA